ncbi:MAG: phenylacetate-CoA oxygenase subunit PaaC [Crocinitomicaceae bacterium]|jgi:ring-1,2-phenylacetyl-CoA epoxidase subunit PaaC|nr:phenylacetate-CoA oxygenase subunit PaaC [Crocinitomicaceae bacterium]MDO7614422.1 phenylacetate-CoA oxygenase subunit PaaC [Crocinitomicaceae bacterium]
MTKQEALYNYVLRLGDDSLILGQRLAELCGHGPILEEDIALTNISLDLIGQATLFLDYAGALGGEKKSNDDLAFLRLEKEYVNALLLEQPNGHFGDTIMRQFLFDAFRKPLLECLQDSSEKELASIAEKALKETKYHLKHSSEWVIRLGDGTDESHEKIQGSLHTLYRYSHELFFEDESDFLLQKSKIVPELNSIKLEWEKTVKNVFEMAGIALPENDWKFEGGRQGRHSEHMGFLLTELQYMQRTYPNMEW